ncbi:MAG: hypothetical protein JWN38_65 [Candidatus Saccharibacteria bacterium]|nr:hypothetical protein [Candidatus Saccharibacteria bacterium]
MRTTDATRRLIFGLRLIGTSLLICVSYIQVSDDFGARSLSHQDHILLGITALLAALLYAIAVPLEFLDNEIELDLATVCGLLTIPLCVVIGVLQFYLPVTSP